MRKPILCLDFDGVIHSYTSGWQGAAVCNDPPVEGTCAFLEEATKHFRVMVYSSRSKSLAGRRAMKRYMRERFEVLLTFSPDHDADTLYELIEFPWFKPPALITIDDRALTFTGNWDDFAPATLKAFQPWNKRRDRDRSGEADETRNAAQPEARARAEGIANNLPETPHE